MNIANGVLVMRNHRASASSMVSGNLIFPSCTKQIAAASTNSGKCSTQKKSWNWKPLVVESYNVQDVAAWCSEQQFESETVYATAEKQSNAFTALYNAAAEGRLHIHPKFKRLISEMETFEYRLEASQGKAMAKFEHAKGCNDDHVYALVWAVYSLRDIELNPYEINGIWCDAPTRVAQMCVLNGGDIEPVCSSECRSYSHFRTLHELHNQRSSADDMEAKEFFEYKVVNIGTRTCLR